MNVLEIGKLYSCEEWYLILYPDKEIAAATAASAECVAERTHLLALNAAAYWSKRLGKAVGYAEKNIPILVLNSKGKYIEVLAGDKKGWIINENFLSLKELR